MQSKVDAGFRVEGFKSEDFWLCNGVLQEKAYTSTTQLSFHSEIGFNPL